MAMEIRVRFGKAIMEMLGAMMLVFTIQLALGSGSPLAPVAIGVVLITIVYAGAPISGAHYNPAISLALWLRGATPFHVMIVYWIFQVIGGILGALLGGIIGSSYSACAVGMGYHTMQAFLAEVVFTFLLCFNVLGVATNNKAENNQYYGSKSYCVGRICFDCQQMHSNTTICDLLVVISGHWFDGHGWCRIGRWNQRWCFQSCRCSGIVCGKRSLQHPLLWFHRCW